MHFRGRHRISSEFIVFGGSDGGKDGRQRIILSSRGSHIGAQVMLTRSAQGDFPTTGSPEMPKSACKCRGEELRAEISLTRLVTHRHGDSTALQAGQAISTSLSNARCAGKCVRACRIIGRAFPCATSHHFADLARSVDPLRGPRCGA